MPRPNSASIVIILDKSGSMGEGNKRGATIEGFNSFIDKQKAIPGEVRLSLVQFDTVYVISEPFGYIDKPIKDVVHLDVLTYVPSGSTALLDAVGRGIDELGGKLSKMVEGDRPEKVIFVIITDGEENSSQEYKNPPGRVAGMVQHQQDIYKWEFLYIGAGPNALKQAAQMSFMASNAAVYANGNEAMAFDVASKSVERGRSGKSMGYTIGERHALVDTSKHPHKI